MENKTTDQLTVEDFILGSKDPPIDLSTVTIGGAIIWLIRNIVKWGLIIGFIIIGFMMFLFLGLSLVSQVLPAIDQFLALFIPGIYRALLYLLLFISGWNIVGFYQRKSKKIKMY